MQWSADEIAARLAGISAISAENAAAPRAGVALVLSLFDTPRLLLMKRAEHPNDPWSGQVSLPGGRAEIGDNDTQATAMRETLEELGVNLNSARHLAPLRPLPATARGAQTGLWVYPHVFALTAPVAPKANHEVAAWCWLPLLDAATGQLDDRVDWPGIAMPLPAWRYQDFVVWGMTYGIVRSFLSIMTPRS